MLTQIQIDTIRDYLYCYRSLARRTLDETISRTFKDPEFKKLLVNEWQRRERELTSLINAISKEIEKEGAKPCGEKTIASQSESAQRQRQSVKPTAGKSTGQAVGSCTCGSSAKSANAQNGKPKRKRSGTRSHGI